MLARRRLLLGLGLGTIAPAFPLFAQPKIARIGILSARSRPTPQNPELFWGSFVEGMRELGYVEGKNLLIEWRYAHGKRERLADLAAELVRLKPAVIVTHGTPAEAVKRATSSIPVVVTSFDDAVRDGFAKSLARPGGNFTGMSLLSSDLGAKYVELLRLMLPEVSQFALLLDPGLSYHSVVLKNARAAAQTMGIQILPVQARNLEEVERGFETMARERIKAVILPASSLSAMYVRQIAELALRHRISMMGVGRPQAVAGSLIIYGADIGDTYRRAAVYVDKILKDAKPGDLPIEQPTRFELVINRKTAKALGVTIPRELLMRADEVIE